MGAVDQSDVKSFRMSLATERVSAWHKKQVPYLIESAVMWAHGNYNLDKSTEKQEQFTEWYCKFLSELQDMSPNLRIRNQTPKKRKREPEHKGKARSHKNKTPKRKPGKLSLGFATEAGINCYGRQALGEYLRFYPRDDTRNSYRPLGRRMNCRFCGRDRVMHKCLACGEVFCMAPPHHLLIPNSNPPRKFKNTGLFCWQLVHGYTSWSNFMNGK